MRYLRLFESFEDIDEICRRYKIRNYTINPDGSIDVNDKIYVYYKGLIKLPLKFNKINGNFSCSRNYLTSLEGSPIEVNGNFLCHNNELTSFQYVPRIIRGYFDCQNNNLTSFEFAPKIIRGTFDCQYNNIKTFEYFPSYIKEFWCDYNPIFKVWILFEDTTKIELLNDFDIFRDEDTNQPCIIMDRLNDFLLTIGEDPVKKVDRYKNI